MVDITDEASLREQLVEQYKHVERIGLNELASGNLSVRFGDGMLISPSGGTADNIATDTIVEVSLEGDWEGERKPSSEWRMHAAIYQKNVYPEISWLNYLSTNAAFRTGAGRQHNGLQCHLAWSWPWQARVV